MERIDPSELTKEKSLWAIYSKTRKFHKNSFNTVFIASVFIFLILFSVYLKEPNDYLFNLLDDWMSFGISLSASVLGFLIAGFAIFATISTHEFFIQSAYLNAKEAGDISYLKYFFFTFVSVFVDYLAVIIILVFFKIFIFQESPFFSSIFTRNYFIERTILKFIIIFVGVSIFYLLIQLKSFVYNVYHVTIALIRYEIERREGKIN